MFFQEVILKLQTFWSKNGCTILQPYDVEMGAGTFHPATTLYTLSEENWNVAYVQPSRRPTDSRFGDHPNRMQHYYQFQVVLKPSPENIQELYLNSLMKIGIDHKKHDIRFVEDDWESPTIGAWGLGWEVWCNGMEIGQFTYMQQIGGIECFPVAGEITYGLERMMLYIQNVNDYRQVRWSQNKLYADIDLESEKQFSQFNLYEANIDMLFSHFKDYENMCDKLLEKKLPLVAYEYCIKLSHIFNVLDARCAISNTERVAYIGRIRKRVRICCQQWLNK